MRLQAWRDLYALTCLLAATLQLHTRPGPQTSAAAFAHASRAAAVSRAATESAHAATASKQQSTPSDSSKGAPPPALASGHALAPAQASIPAPAKAYRAAVAKLLDLGLMMGGPGFR